MAQPLIEKQVVLCAKIESVAGTAETLSGSDGAFNIYDPQPGRNIGITERQGEGTASPIASITEGRLATLSFGTDLVGNGATGLPAWASTFLPTCGMLATGSTYKFVTGSATQKTLTLGTYIDGVAMLIAGAVGKFSIALNAGKCARINFDYTGILVPEGDVALLTPTYPDIDPPRFANANAFTLHGVTPRISTVTFNAENVITPLEDPTNVAGYSHCVIPSRNTTFTADPEKALVATKSWEAAFLAHTRAALAAVVGSTANNTITIGGPKAQLTNVQKGNRNGITIENLTGQFTRSASAGDDEFYITFS